MVAQIASVHVVQNNINKSFVNEGIMHVDHESINQMEIRMLQKFEGFPLVQDGFGTLCAMDAGFIELYRDRDICLTA